MRNHRIRLLLLLPCLAVVLTYAVIKIVIARNSNADTQTFSAIESMDQLALESRIAELKGLEETWKNAKIWAGSIAAILAVFLGIFEILENRAEAKREAAQERLTSLIKQGSDLAIAQAKAQASSAGEKAAKASADAADANERTELARLSAAEASVKAEGFRLEIAQAKERAAQAERMAESERLERIKLEAAVAPRRLTRDQQGTVADKLRRFSGRPPLTVASYSLDGEGSALGLNIIAALKIAGLDARSDLANLLQSGGLLWGVHIHGPEAQQDVVRAIAEALSSEGIRTFVNFPSLIGTALKGIQISGSTRISGGDGATNAGPTAPGTPVHIMVGVKPIE
jgi:hypothetical protein